MLSGLLTTDFSLCSLTLPVFRKRSRGKHQLSRVTESQSITILLFIIVEGEEKYYFALLGRQLNFFIVMRYAVNQ